MPIYLIAYHGHCMDGLASAMIIQNHIVQTADDYQLYTIPMYYGKESKIFDKIKTLKEINPGESINVFMGDFALNREDTKLLASEVSFVTIIDHHKTHKEGLIGLDSEYNNLEIFFDETKSGATLCYDTLENKYDRRFFEYIEDRDIWKWELPFSREISEALRFNISPNVISNMISQYSSFSSGREITQNHPLVQLGDTLIQQTEQYVNMQMASVFPISFRESPSGDKTIDMMAVNSTTYISELGNSIADKHNKPAFIFLFREPGIVEISLRSTNEIGAVDHIAKAHGGGGHPNACGFTMTMEDFNILIMEAKSYQVEKSNK